MRPTRTLAVLAVLVAGLAVMPSAQAAAGDDTEAGGRGARAVVRDVGGAVVGIVSLHTNRGKLTVSGRLTGLSPGFHGFHVHAVGVCDPAATDPAGTVVPFLSAGGHLDVDGSTHGHHAGDMPVLFVAADGTALTVTENDRLTMARLFDADRSAVIIHALPDNYANIPARYSAAGVPGPDAATRAAGDAGARVACGVVVRR